MTNAALRGKPYAGNPHVRFDEGEVASCTAEASLRRVHCRRQPEGRASVCAATPRRGSLLYKQLAVKACAAALVAVVTGVLAARASEVELKWTLEKGGVEKESRALVEKDGAFSLRLSRDEIRAKGAKKLEIVPDFARAKKGEDGFWVLPKGQYGTFRCDDGSCGIGTPAMSMFGMKTPRCAFVAIVKGLKYYFGANVIAKNGEYAMNCVLGDELCRDPYEDFEIGFHMLAGKDATLGGMARVYRNYQLERGAVRPLKERIKGNDTLKYAVESLEIRIRQAWKPVPSPVPDQVPENEPAIKRVAVTFDRVGDIVRELKRQGVGKAELCLVGWNVGGHDGRWPQSFPVEERLGGEAKLRQCIKDALDAGYLIVPHGNYRDAYRIADNWDIEYLIKDENGDPVQAHPVFWGGGRQFQVCPRRAYEFWASREMPRMAALGFKGIAYFDCITLLPAPVCSDPRHPLNRAESARFWGKSAEMSCKCFGGFSSEGPVDHAAGFLDSVLNASGGLNPATKNSGLVDRVVPMWQLVYNGIITGNPFATTINFTTQSPLHRLKMLEFGGRPWFYFYSKFVDDGTDWMGEHDLGCATDEELAKSVAKIKAGWDIYSKVNRLQFEYMREHEQLAPDVFLTTWEDGTRIVTNYGSAPYAFEGRTVAPEDYLVVE